LRLYRRQDPRLVGDGLQMPWIGYARRLFSRPTNSLLPIPEDGAFDRPIHCRERLRPKSENLSALGQSQY